MHHSQIVKTKDRETIVGAAREQRHLTYSQRNHLNSHTYIFINRGEEKEVAGHFFLSAERPESSIQ